MLYHASPVGGLELLEPRVSGHGTPLVYFSEKRENTLVYLSNAVEKYCRETGFEYGGVWSKWGSYGFDPDGVLRLDEYYPNAAADTYKGVSGYIYRAQPPADVRPLDGVPFAAVSEHPVAPDGCEYVADAYDEILRAVEDGRLRLRRYPEFAAKAGEWLVNTINAEYASAAGHPEYRHFLKGRFGSLLRGGVSSL